MIKTTFSEYYTNFDFPLNVYAYCLYLQEGKVDYLHYGLFNTGESVELVSVSEAQLRATMFIIFIYILTLRNYKEVKNKYIFLLLGLSIVLYVTRVNYNNTLIRCS